MTCPQRYSRQRETIHRVIQETNAHPTAEWIYDHVRREIPNISLGTVYRNLHQLVEAGRLIQLEDGGIARFDARMEPHDHFHCRKCGKWFDIERPDLKALQDLGHTEGFQLESLSIEMRGLCPACQPDIAV